MKTDPTTDTAAELSALQKRKAAVNTELVSVNKRRDALQVEAEELAKRHLQLLRHFDSVAKLP